MQLDSITIIFPGCRNGYVSIEAGYILLKGAVTGSYGTVLTRTVILQRDSLQIGCQCLA